MLVSRHMLRACGDRSINITISADAYNVNLHTLAGSPSGAVAVTVTIESGVKIKSTTPATASLVTGAFPSGSVVKLVNNGHVHGAGGVGDSYNAPGYAGGDAISLGCNVSIDNANGEIFGGGGGGGASGSLEYRKGWTGSFWYYWNEGDPLNDPDPNSSGAGGGGQGEDGGGGGTGDAGGGASNGSAGTASGGGIGAAGVNNGGLRGGTGGSWGSAGGAGENNGYSEDSWDHSESGIGKHWRVAGRRTGANGSAAGRAVRKNGNSISWIAGNNSARVKGAVS